MSEKKIGDLSIGLLIAIFCISAFSYIIISFDNNTNNSENLGLTLSTLSNSTQQEFSLNSEDLQANTFGSNGSSFIIKDNQYIDTRGSSQANLIATKYPSTITSFVKNAFNLLKFDSSGLILWLIIALLSTVAIILLLRSFLGGFRI